MKKYIIVFTAAITLVLLFTGCKPGFSEDSFESIEIFNESHTFIYERTEDEAVNEVTYEVTVDGNLVSTKVEIDFDEGSFISESEFMADTLKPVSAFKSNTYDLDPDKDWEITATYGQALDMVARTESDQETRSLELPEYFLDNEGLLFTVGALTLEEGFDKDINVAIIDAGEIIPFRVTYQGIEQIDSPFGTYDCIKVEMKYTGLVLGPKPSMYIYYTNDLNRYPVLYINKDVELRLKDIK